MTYRYCYLHLKQFLEKKNLKSVRTYDDLLSFDQSNNLLDYVIRMESLEDDLIRVLSEVGHKLDESSIQWIYDQKKQKINKSEHRNYGYYYDEETIELIMDQERFIIEKYDYKPPQLD